jgi:uncharacterized UBP type Zn finger protein
LQSIVTNRVSFELIPSDISSRLRCPSDHVGLVNLGNICYMNAVHQQFFMMPAFRKRLMSIPADLVLDKDLSNNLLWQVRTFI